MPNYAHLHCHTQYSLLDGAAPIGAMMDKAKADGQLGVAITDHGNMFGAFKFVAEARKRNLKPIIGCEFYMVDDRHRKEFSRAKGEKDNRYHQLLLAKNRKGYENLSKLCSIGYVEGLYSKWPRIDKEALEGRTEGLIATSCCIGAIVPQLLWQGKDAEAEEELKWWLARFGDDYYIELQRHKGLENIDNTGVSQEDINQKLLRLAAKHKVKTIVTNDSHYLEEEDAEPHDILLCINTGERQENTDRFKFPSSDFFFKTQEQMSRLFADVPEAVDRTLEIVDKVEDIKLERDILLPNYPLPAGFTDQDAYLRHITYEGAQRKYGLGFGESHRERLDFELDVIKQSGYPGYFLIVQDFTTEARKLGVSVGPGRGSAAGSAVAYCLGITNVDPIKYDLLFERFLNPERVSMPDIDIDFDDEGRQKVIDYVVDKYGKNQVAQIITYGSMKAKSAVRDVGRVMDIPLSEVDTVAKSFPDHLAASLEKVLKPGGMDKDFRGLLNAEDAEKAERFRQFATQKDHIGQMIRTAQRLEGSVRNTGIHACGVIITPDDITKYVPVLTAKDSDLLVSQFDNSVAEEAGLLKMDFLGLKTLTIIRDAVRMVKDNHGVDLDMDLVDLADEKTYQLFQRGETVGVFQYESGGMQKHLIALAPTEFADLIAMNALYRPGPMQYIPDFCDRKHGRAPVTFDLQDMEEYLHETYGICLAGDALVYDADTGAQVRIDQLEDRVGNFYVQGVDDDLNAQRAKATHWMCNGVRQTYEVRLRSGKKLRLTANHELLGEDGWQRLDAFNAGDYLATPERLDVIDEQEFDEDRLRVLAYLIADGSLSSVGPTADFVNKDARLLTAYKASVTKAFDRLETTSLMQVRGVERVMVRGVDKTHYHEANSLVAWLRDLGLKTTTGGCRSQEKFIPDFVFGLSPKLLCKFLAAYWDCDGYIGKKTAFIKTISPHLASGLQTLLLRLGIQSTVYESYYRTQRDGGAARTAYQVTVHDLRALERTIKPYLIAKAFEPSYYTEPVSSESIRRQTFLAELDQVFHGTGRELMEEYELDCQQVMPKARKRPRISKDIIAVAADRLMLEGTQRAMRVHWDEIISITPAGEEAVYDITVEGIHNFVANGIIVHNCVYQEQIMLLSQKLAGFSKGEADTLRKAMGKKQKAVLDKMYPRFVEGCKAKGHPENKLEKIWKDWEHFAAYAFNKSHSTCYAFVAFQTAWLKAHYPAEYMAAVLTHNKSDQKKLTFFLRECRRMNIKVLGPDVNESKLDFGVNAKGQIRFGLSAVKGVGEGPVEEILSERAKNGPYESLFGLVRRLDLRQINKKVLESLALGGGFDGFEGLHRAQYFCPSDDGKYGSLLEYALRYGQAWQHQKATAANSLFGATTETMVPEPDIADCAPWPLIEALDREKEVVGIYISGHPLDDYEKEVKHYSNCTIEDLETKKGEPIKLAVVVQSVQHRVSKKGTGWGLFVVGDQTATTEFALFSEDYQQFKHALEAGQVVLIDAKYEERWGREGEFQLRLNEVTMMEAVAIKRGKGITLHLPVQIISQDFIDRLDDLCKVHHGPHSLRLLLIEPHSETAMPFVSQRTVLANTDFIREVEGLGVEYVMG